MISIKLKFKLDSPLTLSLSYHHKIQSIIYNFLKEDMNFSTSLHDGFNENSRSFKFFTFSSLSGKCSIHNKCITFYDFLSFEIRSILDGFSVILQRSLASKSWIEIDNSRIYLDSKIISSKEIDESSINIKMLSPITVYKTDDNKTIFFNPLDDEFNSYVNQNFKRKYDAFYGYLPDEDLILTPLNISLKDKYVTKFKDTYITAWRGDYNLKGPKEYINFLYYTGLGAKNSEGFGMFSIS